MLSLCLADLRDDSGVNYVRIYVMYTGHLVSLFTAPELPAEIGGVIMYRLSL